MTWTAAAVALLILYLCGVGYWLALLLYVPCIAVLTFLWAYIGKYFWPPKLVRSVVDIPSVLGLGPKP